MHTYTLLLRRKITIISCNMRFFATQLVFFYKKQILFIIFLDFVRFNAYIWRIEIRLSLDL